MFKPHLETLPSAQRALWPTLGEVPPHFVLYGGTALALRLGHRVSIDFDLFSSKPFVAADLLNSLALLKSARTLQSTKNTLTVVVDLDGPVKVSFFGGLSLGRVGDPDLSPDGVLEVASLLDLAGTKAALVTQRAESKDYLDLLAIVAGGISLSEAMGAALALYPENYNPLLTLKSLAYFGDGDLHKLSEDQKAKLTDLVNQHPYSIPQLPKRSANLSARA